MSCSVCQRSVSRQHSVQVWGKQTCPSGFVTDYLGFVLAESASYAGRSQYICTDMNAEAAGSAASENGFLFYPVEVTLASPLTDKYIPFLELFCAVCSACGGDQFLLGNSSSCSVAKMCEAGTYVSVPQSTSSDRQCSFCPKGTYMSLSNHAKESCVECPLNQIQVGIA